MPASSRLPRRFRIVCRTCCEVVEAYMPPWGPGMNPLFAEQYNVSPAKTHGLAVGLGGMFFGRIARRWFRSRTATPVYPICTPSGRLDTSMVAQIGRASCRESVWVVDVAGALAGKT